MVDASIFAAAFTERQKIGQLAQLVQRIPTSRREGRWFGGPPIKIEGD
jgi:hypothetical protein